MRHTPSHPRVRADHDHAPGHPRDRLLAAAFRPARLTHACCLVACLLAAPLAAQTQTPASTDAAQDRSQKQSDSVYRWIKIHSEPPRKSEPTPKPRPKAEAAQQAARKPEVPASPSQPAPTEEARAETLAPLPMPEPAREAPAASAPASPPGVAMAAATPAPTEPADVELRPISQPQPEIPRELRTSIATGRVMLSFTVEPNGRVTDAAVVRTTNRRLAKPALDAVSQWRFEPIRIARAVQVEIEFNLQ